MSKYIPKKIKVRGSDAIHIPKKCAAHFYKINQRQGVMMYNEEFYLRLSEMSHAQKMYLTAQNIPTAV